MPSNAGQLVQQAVAANMGELTVQNIELQVLLQVERGRTVELGAQLAQAVAKVAQLEAANAEKATT